MPELAGEAELQHPVGALAHRGRGQELECGGPALVGNGHGGFRAARTPDREALLRTAGAIGRVGPAGKPARDRMPQPSLAPDAGNAMDGTRAIGRKERFVVERRAEGRMRLFAVAVLSALVAVAAPVSAQIRINQPAGTSPTGQKVLATIDPDTLLRIMKISGFSATELTKVGDMPAVKATIDGFETYVVLTDCTGTSCVSMLFQANFDKQETFGQDLINRYNAEKSFSKLYVNTNGQLLLEAVATTYRGVTEDYIAGQAEIWIRSYKEALSFQPKQ